MEDFDITIFAQRLKELRTDKGLSTRALGAKVSTSGTSISRWELAQRLPNVDLVYNLAKFFNVTSDYLLGLEDHY